MKVSCTGKSRKHLWNICQ